MTTPLTTHLPSYRAFGPLSKKPLLYIGKTLAYSKQKESVPLCARGAISSSLIQTISCSKIRFSYSQKQCPATQILFLSATRETKASQKTNISPRHCRTGYTMAPSAKRHSSHNSSSPFSLIIYSQRLILTRGDLQQQQLNHIH